MTEPVLGFRVWRRQQNRLRSWVMDYDWTPGTNTAQCLGMGRVVQRFDPHTAPGEQYCSCGFWALNSPRSAAFKSFERSFDSIDIANMVGLVAGWGTVAKHGDEGWRAQYAAIKCLFTIGTHGWLVNRHLRVLADKYGVPLLPILKPATVLLLWEFGVSQQHAQEVVNLRSVIGAI